MKSYLIVNATANLDNQEAIQKYSEGVLPLLLEAGGKPPIRAQLDHVIKGKAAYTLFLFMEFPDQQPILDLFESEEYQKLLPYREKAFNDLNIYTFQDL